MTDRDADAAALAGAMGWTLEVCRWTNRPFFQIHKCGMGYFIPAATAPLGEQFAFVGRLTEAISGPNAPDTSVNVEFVPSINHYRVGFGGEFRFGDDLVHAAIRAALAAKGAT